MYMCTPRGHRNKRKRDPWTLVRIANDAAAYPSGAHICYKCFDATGALEARFGFTGTDCCAIHSVGAVQ